MKELKARYGKPVCCACLACELSRANHVERPCATTALDVRPSCSIEAEGVNLANRAQDLGFPSVPQFFAVALDGVGGRTRPTTSPLRYTVERAANDARSLGPHAVVAVLLRTADPESEEDVRAFYWHIEQAREELAVNDKQGLRAWEPTFVSVRRAEAA